MLRADPEQGEGPGLERRGPGVDRQLARAGDRRLDRVAGERRKISEQAAEAVYRQPIRGDPAGLLRQGRRRALRRAHDALAQRRGGGAIVVLVEHRRELAAHVLKKKMQREGIFREMKQRKAYEKPSERKTREKAEAVRRARKAERKTAIRMTAEP